MNMRRLVSTTSLTGVSPAGFGLNRRRQPWDRKFRVMKDPEGHAAAAGADTGSTQQPPTNNQGGNGGGQSGESQGSDNAGSKFDLAQFWQGSDGGGTGTAPTGESAGTTTQPPSGQQQGNQPPVTNPTVEAIKSLNFGNGIMTDQVMKDLSEGKTEGFHTAMTQFGQQAVEQSLRTVLPIMAQLRDQMREEMKSQVNGTLQTRDNMSDLFKAIPSADTPALRPTVTSIFDRAMTHTKGDRTAAIAMTKDMLRFQAETTGTDLGIPPRTAGDGSAAQPSKVDWLSELAGR